MINLLKLILTFGFLIINHKVLASNYGHECRTPRDENGKCVPIKSCARAYSMLIRMSNSANRPNLSEVRELQRSQCDLTNGVPFICCPTSEIQMNPEVIQHLSTIECGRSATWKIANGERAALFEFPWMVLLSSDENPLYRCGGSLISERFVLTAAHCLQELENTYITVRLGEYDITTEIDCVETRRGKKCQEPHEDIGVDRVFMPENYKYGDLYDDIALLRLETPVKFKKHIQPICLPITKQMQSTAQEQYLVAGWGYTETGQKSNILLFTAVPKKPNSLCEEKFLLPQSRRLHYGHICAGGERLRDSCKGDSGSPIFLPDIYVDGAARVIQYGLVSLGVRSCGEVSLPAIYTNISYHMQWITDHMSL